MARSSGRLAAERAVIVLDRGTELLAAARRSIEAGRTVAGRALVDAVRGVGADPAALDELDARLMLDEGRTGAALALAGVAIEREPDKWRLRCLRADIRLAARDATDAAIDAADAVVLAPREPAPKAALGSALLALGQAHDAAACLAEAVAAQPAHVGYRLALARAQAMRGDTAAARTTLDEAIALRPRALALRVAAMRLAVGIGDFEGALVLADAAADADVFDACILGLRGHALSCLGREEAAMRAYRDALQLGPEDAYVRHLVAAAGLVAPPSRASPEYVRVLFDGFAARFEADLVRLGYRVPGLMRALLLEQAPHLAAVDPASPAPRLAPRLGPVLDLGCGTGLVALLLSDLAVGPFTGIDLSPGMLAEAAAKGLYERLIEGDICGDLSHLGRFAVAVAADVLPYLGDPAPLLRAVRPCLADGGLFLLSAEALGDEGDDAAPFRLGPRARYAHRPDALCAAAREAGFAVSMRRGAVLRLDRDQPVGGCVLALRAAGSTGE